MGSKSDKKSADGFMDFSQDVLAKAEILSPGIEPTQDLKKRALQNCLSTAEGKEVIQSIAHDGINDSNVDVVFSATAEMLKARRSSTFNNVVSDGASTTAVKSISEIQKSYDDFFGKKTY